jgi:hypothetical protein
MWRGLIIPAVAALVLLSGATAARSSGGISCGSATPVDPSAPLGRAIPLAHVVWLAVYPFNPGYPTKTIVMAQRRIQRPVVIRGWNCTSGSPLRFWYRIQGGLPFVRVPTTVANLRRTGSLSVTLGPWPARAMWGGYFMFWRSGLWKVVAYQDGRKIGTAIVRAASH